MTTPTGPGGANWERVPGQTTRRYRNVQTGEVISRRQYDERFGRLARQGLASNEAQGRALRAAGVAPGPARGRLKHVRRGDTDYFNAPRTLNGYRQKLDQLIRYGYTGLRVIYGRPGEEHSATSGWYVLSTGNIPYILNDLQLDFQYDGNSPLYHFRDIQFLAATKGAVATGVSRARAGY